MKIFFSLLLVIFLTSCASDDKSKIAPENTETEKTLEDILEESWQETQIRSREENRKKLAFTQEEEQLMADFPIAGGTEIHVALTSMSKDLMPSLDAEKIISDSLSYDRIHGTIPSKILVSQVLSVDDENFRLAAYFVKDVPILDIESKYFLMEEVDRFYRIRFAVFNVGSKKSNQKTGAKLVNVVDFIQGSNKERETVSGYIAMMSYGIFNGFEIDHLLQYFNVDGSPSKLLKRIPELAPAIPKIDRIVFSPIITSETTLWESLSNSSGQAIEASDMQFLGSPFVSYVTRYVAVKRLNNTQATDPFVIFDTDQIEELTKSKILKANLNFEPNVTKLDLEKMTIVLEGKSKDIYEFSLGSVILKKETK